MHLVPPPGNGRSQLASPSSRGLRAPKRARRFSAFAVLGGGESLRRIRRVASCALSVSASRGGAGGGTRCSTSSSSIAESTYPRRRPNTESIASSLAVAFADAAELDTASGEAAGTCTNDHVNEAGHAPAHCFGYVRWGCALAARGHRSRTRRPPARGTGSARQATVAVGPSRTPRQVPRGRLRVPGKLEGVSCDSPSQLSRGARHRVATRRARLPTESFNI